MPTPATGVSAPHADAPCVAVVVHYVDAAATARCVQSLRAQQPPPRIVVVDNASPDGSGHTLDAAFAGLADVVVLRAERNGGFGAGCNRGIDLALQRWPDLAHVLLLNPDATLTPGSLAEMRATAHRHPRAGLVGCRIDRSDGSPWYGNGRWPGWTLSGFHRPPPAGASEHRAGFVTGCCMLLAGELLRDGLRFDEDYFLYCEDADLCREVEARGRELWVTQQAVAQHDGGGSQPGERVLGELNAGRLYWLSRAKVLLARRRLRPLQRAVFLAVAWLLKPIAGLVHSRSGRFLGPYLRGLRDGWRQRLPLRS